MNLYFRLLTLLARRTRQPAIGIWDVARTAFRVAPSDLDLLGHMNNGKYLSLLDVGRMDLLLRSGVWPKLRAKGWYPVVAGQTITYRRSLKLGQRFDLLTRVVGFDDRWVFIEQTFVVGEVVHAQAIVRGRFLRQSGGSVEHDELEALVGGFPADRQIPAWMSEWTAATKVAG